MFTIIALLAGTSIATENTLKVLNELCDDLSLENANRCTNSCLLDLTGKGS